MYKELVTYAELLFCSLHLLLFRRSPCRRRRSFVRSLMTEDSSKDNTNRCLFFIRVIFVFIYLIGHFYLSYIDKKKRLRELSTTKGTKTSGSAMQACLKNSNEVSFFRRQHCLTWRMHSHFSALFLFTTIDSVKITLIAVA